MSEVQRKPARYVFSVEVGDTGQIISALEGEVGFSQDENAAGLAEGLRVVHWLRTRADLFERAIREEFGDGS